MHLLFIIDNLGSGGAQRQMVNLALSLQRRDHEVEFFLYYPQYEHFAPGLREAGIRIHSFKKTWRFSVRVVPALRQLLKRGGYNAALSFLGTPSFYAEIAKIGLRRVPLVVSERFMYTGRSLNVNRWILQQAHRIADYITVNSHHQRERMEDKFPWMRRKICTIYNGVDLDYFSPPAIYSVESREALNLLVLSSVVPKKNPKGLVMALSKYRYRYGAFCTIRWAGKVGHDESSQKIFQETNQLIKKLGLEAHWYWLGERKDIPDLLRSCDALIHPSFFEGLPNAVCEALACGRPVLASNLGDHSIMIKDGISGFLLNPWDPEDIAGAIHKFNVLSIEARNEMGRKARLFAESELSLEEFTEKYEALFTQLAGRCS